MLLPAAMPGTWHAGVSGHGGACAARCWLTATDCRLPTLRQPAHKIPEYLIHSREYNQLRYTTGHA